MSVKSAEPYFPPHEMEWVLSRVNSILSSGVLTSGPFVDQLENGFADFVGTRHAIAVSNGTAALEVCLRHFGLNGAEVIVPTNTFIASANAVILAGGKVVFADIDPKTLCSGLEQIKSQVSERTRGVVLVHIAGMICPDIAEIVAFCRDRGLFVIEDAAHAHGAAWNEAKAGAWGTAGAFSFFPTKPMTTGEGGIVTTNDDALAAFARMFRNHGISDRATRLHTHVGHNYRMGEINAVIGLSQLRCVNDLLSARRKLADQYRARLSGIADIETIPVPPNMAHSYYKFPILLPTVAMRNAVSEALREKHQIETGSVYWPPCHMQPVAKTNPGLYCSRSAMIAAEDVLPRILCLPIHPKLTEESVEHVVRTLAEEIKRL